MTDTPFLYQMIFLFLFSGISFFVLLRLVDFWFRKLWLLDNPKKFGYKRDPVPYSMGVTFFLQLLITSFLFPSPSFSRILVVLILGAVVTFVSFLDDWYNISPKIRLALQICVWAVVGVTSIKIGYVSGIFGNVVHLPDYWLQLADFRIYLIPFLFTVVWYVLVFNSVNWSDGIPGLTSGLSFIALLVILVLTIKLYLVDTTPAAKENSEFVFHILAVLLPATLIFCFYDFRHKIIMGDSGTMFLAFIIATLAIIAGGKVATVAAVLGVYLVDAIYVIFARLYHHQSPLGGDRIHHLHFRLLSLGLSETFVRFFVYGLAFFFGMSAIFLDRYGKIALLFLLCFVIFFITKIVSLGSWSKKE